MDSFDHDLADKVMSKVTEKTAAAKLLLLAVVIANMGIVFVFERSGWAAAASLIAILAGGVGFRKIIDTDSLTHTAITILAGFTTKGISETLDLKACANKNNTNLHGKVATTPTGGVDADKKDFLRFDIAVENVDCDHVIGVTWPCGYSIAKIFKEKLSIGTRISIDGNFVGRIQGDDPERRFCMEYFVSSLKILKD